MNKVCYGCKLHSCADGEENQVIDIEDDKQEEKASSSQQQTSKVTINVQQEEQKNNSKEDAKETPQNSEKDQKDKEENKEEEKKKEVKEGEVDEKKDEDVATYKNDTAMKKEVKEEIKRGEDAEEDVKEEVEGEEDQGDWDFSGGRFLQEDEWLFQAFAHFCGLIIQFTELLEELNIVKNKLEVKIASCSYYIIIASRTYNVIF